MESGQAVPVLVAALAEEYREAATRYAGSAVELDRLMTAADRGEGRHEEADDYRHYTYLENTEHALAAAMRLLAALGYRIEAADEEDSDA